MALWQRESHQLRIVELVAIHSKVEMSGFEPESYTVNLRSLQA